MRVFIPFLLSLLIGGIAEASPPAQAESAGTDAMPTALKVFVAKKTAPHDEARLAKAVGALKPSTLYMSKRAVAQLVDAVIYASRKTGVDPYFLIAVARMESDFRHDVQMIHPKCYRAATKNCDADCGITQHWISGPKAWVIRYCKRLVKHPRLAVLKSAEELARHIKFCSGKSRFAAWSLQALQSSGAPNPMQACVLQRYNSGPRFYHANKCARMYRCRRYVDANENTRGAKPRWIPNPTYRRCAYKRSKCFGRAHYYAQALCFAYGARNGVSEKRSCRRCRDTRKIATDFYAPLTKPDTSPKAPASADATTAAR